MDCRAFDYQIEYLQHMKKAMVDVKTLIPHSKTKITMVKQEVGVHDLAIVVT